AAAGTHRDAGAPARPGAVAGGRARVARRQRDGAAAPGLTGAGAGGWQDSQLHCLPRTSHVAGCTLAQTVIECSATRLPSLSAMIARKPLGAIECLALSTLPPWASAAATAASRRPLASM